MKNLLTDSGLRVLRLETLKKFAYGYGIKDFEILKKFAYGYGIKDFRILKKFAYGFNIKGYRNISRVSGAFESVLAPILQLQIYRNPIFSSLAPSALARHL